MRTHNIPFSIKTKKITLNYPKSAAIGCFSKGLKYEFETAVVNESSVFEPLKFYCTVTIINVIDNQILLVYKQEHHMWVSTVGCSSL